jgi:hypothetical protein
MKRIAITLSAVLVAVGIGVAGLGLASTGSANPAAQARSPKLATNCVTVGPAHTACFAAATREVPGFVKACLAVPASERGACFAAAAGGKVPGFVKACLAVPASERGACFAPTAGGQVPDPVARCLTLPPADRAVCFRSQAKRAPTAASTAAHVSGVPR